MLTGLFNIHGWTTRIRTGNDRTKTCSVTITPWSNMNICCKGNGFPAISKILTLNFSIRLGLLPFLLSFSVVLFLYFVAGTRKFLSVVFSAAPLPYGSRERVWDGYD